MQTINPQEDGITHINIYTKSNCKLGKMLSNMYQSPFNFQGINFNSIEQAWHYFKFKDNDVQKANHILSLNSSFECLKYAKANKTIESTKIALSDSFKELMCSLIRSKIMNDNTLKLMLRNSFLPLEHYYAYGTDNPKVHDQKDKYLWMIESIEHTRYELQEDYLTDLISKYGNLCNNQRYTGNNGVYVGRSGKNIKSIFGNPFPVAKETKDISKYVKDKAVALSVMQFRHYLVHKISDNSIYWYKHLTTLKGKVLKCFCTNGTTSRDLGANFCHSLILASFADQLDVIYETTKLKKQ